MPRWYVTVPMDFERVWPGGIDDEIERRLAEAGRLAPWSNAVEVNAGPFLEVCLAVDQENVRGAIAAGRRDVEMILADLGVPRDCYRLGRTIVIDAETYRREDDDAWPEP